jgi:hypothetical protein
MAASITLMNRTLYKHNIKRNQPRQTDDMLTNSDGLNGRMVGDGALRPFYYMTEQNAAPYVCSVAEVSSQLVERRGKAHLLAKGSANTLAMAWIHFMVHDWLNHDADQEGKSGNLNVNTPFWDGSQIYGNSKHSQKKIRRYKKGLIHLPFEHDKLNVGVSDNHWFGLHVLHDLFAREHNYVARMLADEYPSRSDEELFKTAQLIITASIARIHTVEWTPALFGNEVQVSGQWYLLHGLWGMCTEAYTPVPEWLKQTQVNELMGSFGSKYESVAFQHPEEFVAAYRLHSLLPDTYKVGEHTYDITQIQDWRRICYYENNMHDCITSLLVESPAVFGLHNTPVVVVSTSNNERTVREVNFARIDVARNRERNLPRFNQLRRYIGLKAYASIDELIPPSNPDNQVLKVLYKDDIENIDLHVGLLAERKIDQSAFGETTYVIFMCQTQQRLINDPFFTKFYSESYYTPAGMRYVERARMEDILRRHHPKVKISAGVFNTPSKP